MRVLTVINSLGIGGAETLVTGMIPRLKRLEIDSDIYILAPTKSFLEEDLLKQGFNIYTPRKRASVYSFTHVWNLRLHLKHHRYDIVHAHLFPTQLWVALAVRSLSQRVALLTTEHNTYNRRRKTVFYPLDRWMYAQYKHIVCISDGVESALLDWMPRLKHGGTKTSVIVNGTDIQRFQSAAPIPKEKLIKNSKGSLVLFVARFEQQKDHETLIKAIGLLDDVHLVLVGDGPRRSYAEKLVSELNLTSRVHFLGRRSDVPEIMKTADIYVHSARWEGFGLAAVEAMASGLPVIASRVPGLETVVGDSGLWFDPGNYNQLAEQLQKVLQDRAFADALSARGKEQSKLYSIDTMAARYAELYKRLIGA